MKLPRFSISAIMGLVALIAVDFAAIQTAARSPTSDRLMIVCLGTLPMATILAVGSALRIARARRGEDTTFLATFLVLGVIEAAVFAGSLLFFPGPTVAFHRRTIVAAWLWIVVKTGLHWRPIYLVAFGIPFYVTYFTAPQVVLAWLAGRAYRNYRRRMELAPRAGGRSVEEGA